MTEGICWCEVHRAEVIEGSGICRDKYKTSADARLDCEAVELLSRAEWEAQNNKPRLGLATNRQLIKELSVRLER